MLIDMLKEKDFDVTKIITAADCTINELKSNISNLNKKIQDYNIEIMKRNEIISDYENIINKQSENIHELNETINENNENILNLQIENNSLAKNVEKDKKYFENYIQNINAQYDYLINQLLSVQNSLNEEISLLKSINTELKNEFNVIKNQNEQYRKSINDFKEDIGNKNVLILKNEKLIKKLENDLNETSLQLHSLEYRYNNQRAEINTNKYLINDYKIEIENNYLEIKYLKQNSFIKKLLNPFSYIYLVVKSNPKEIFLNFKLYKTLKNSEDFDIGFYLNNNKDIIESRWYKYFSPELHYVCAGFDEKREFNKFLIKKDTKQDLLENIG